MSLRYRIGLVFGIVVMLVTLSMMSKLEYDYSNQKDNFLPAQGTAQKEEIYFLKELNGYVAVYYEDRISLYECTNIRVEELPLNVQAEISKGKEIIGTIALYGFLENYSS